jgi:hypothetical protein
VTLLPVITVGIEADALALTTLPTITVLADINQGPGYKSAFVSVATLPTDNSFALAE